MKRTCVAPVCMALLVMGQAASAQENGSVKSDELARTGMNYNRQNSTSVTAADSQVRPDSTDASQPPNTEAAAILEVGAEPARSLSGGGWTFSPTVAVEVTPIENWLELEFGVTPTFTHHSTEWDTDLLFKKPWTLSKKVEFMFGVGPELIHIRKNGITADSLAGEIALDFMFWPSPTRRFGWYIEPAYDYTFGRSHDQAIGVSIGLLISVR
jgi:hypothetical protein